MRGSRITARVARRGRLAGVAAVAAAALVLAACGGGSGGGGGGSGGGGGGGSGGGSPQAGGYLATAQAHTDQNFKGTVRNVDPTSRPAAKDKKLVIISFGLAVTSNKVPTEAAAQAARSMGWNTEVYDAKLNTANANGLVRQAIAAGADGIIMEAIDCQTALQGMKEAKAKGIVMVPLYSFDCSDKEAGNSPDSYFSGSAVYGPNREDVDTFTESYGANQADYVIAKSNNKAKIIVVTDDTVTVLRYTYRGFVDTVNKSGGSQVVSTLKITPNDIVTNKLVAKIQAEILRHPEATWIKSPYTYATTLGIVPALGSRAGTLKVMGSEGFPEEIALLRQGKVSAVNLISSEWSGYAAVDAMNSLFRKEPIRDSGLGWQMVDKEHNLPASGQPTIPVDFRSEFKKAWGVSQ